MKKREDKCRRLLNIKRSFNFDYLVIKGNQIEIAKMLYLSRKLAFCRGFKSLPRYFKKSRKPCKIKAFRAFLFSWKTWGNQRGNQNTRSIKNIRRKSWTFDVLVDGRYTCISQVRVLLPAIEKPARLCRCGLYYLNRMGKGFAFCAIIALKFDPAPILVSTPKFAK